MQKRLILSMNLSVDSIMFYIDITHTAVVTYTASVQESGLMLYGLQ